MTRLSWETEERIAILADTAETARAKVEAAVQALSDLVDELGMIGLDDAAGDVESAIITIQDLVNGAAPVEFGRIPDNAEYLARKMLKEAAEYDRMIGANRP